MGGGQKRKYYQKPGGTEKEKKAKLKFGNSFNKLSINQKGFLITYNCKFTFCVNEAKKLLQQFSAPELNESDTEETKGNDLDKELQQELDELNKRDKEFQTLDTGANYTIFITLDSVDPTKVVRKIFEDMEINKRPLGRYIQRLLPIANTCKAHLEDIQKCIATTLDPLPCMAADAKPMKFCCIFKTSNNGSLKRDDIFRMVGHYFHSKNSGNKCDFDAPDRVLILQIICNMAFIGFVENYYQYKKYNFQEQGNKFVLDKPAKPVTTDTQVTTDEKTEVLPKEQPENGKMEPKIVEVGLDDDSDNEEAHNE